MVGKRNHGHNAGERYGAMHPTKHKQSHKRGASMQFQTPQREHHGNITKRRSHGAIAANARSNAHAAA